MFPQIAIIDTNTLAVIGLKSVLQSIMPMMQIDTYNSFEELQTSNAERYFHYFVSLNIVLDNRTFFVDNRRKTIVLTTSSDPNSRLSGFHSLCINQPEHLLIKSILMLEQKAHGQGRNLPPVPKDEQDNILSDREIEVLSLIVQGYINKEIAEKLSIALATVITHRRKIMEKLNVKSVSALTIYAVTHGYVDIKSI